MALYGDIEIGQHQAITWTNVEVLKAISQEILKIAILDMNLRQFKTSLDKGRISQWPIR